jgi:ATP-binding cassette, subfamily B, multidrug efflux pump
LIDGQLVSEMAAGERAARLGYMSQEAYLFSGSIQENILLSIGQAKMMAEPNDAIVKAVNAAVNEATVNAALTQDLTHLPAGLQTEVGDRGVRVSGGQRKRIALARTLFYGAGRQPGLLVLDDPFASIDVATEREIIHSLKAAFGAGASPDHRATIVLCSHRLAVFPQADFIIILDQGRIIGKGRHEELVRSNDLYHRIYLAQRQMTQYSDAGEETPG